MLVVKDAMVLIHLSKLTLLEKVCNFFEEVMIPELVYEETVRVGREKGYEDAILIEELTEDGTIGVRKVEEEKYLERAEKFNIQGGESETVALYWQEDADLLATDDDNVRKKKELLNLSLIGTPALILKLWKKDEISKEKIKSIMDKLKKIGWFSTTVIDKIKLEVEKNG